MPTEHFKSREAYRRNLAYRHMHGIPFTAEDVVVAGKKHKVKHTKSGERARLDATQKKKMAHRGHNSTRRANQHMESETHAYHY